MQIATVTPKEVPKEIPPAKQVLVWEMVMRADMQLDEEKKRELMLL